MCKVIRNSRWFVNKVTETLVESGAYGIADTTHWALQPQISVSADTKSKQKMEILLKPNYGRCKFVFKKTTTVFLCLWKTTTLSPPPHKHRQFVWSRPNVDCHVSSERKRRIALPPVRACIRVSCVYNINVFCIPLGDDGGWQSPPWARSPSAAKIYLAPCFSFIRPLVCIFQLLLLLRSSRNKVKTTATNSSGYISFNMYLYVSLVTAPHDIKRNTYTTVVTWKKLL